MRRGDFDDLPGAGQPLRLPDTHDPDWWIHQRLASGDIDARALLPVVVLLRREFEEREATLAALDDEQAAREFAADFTERVHRDRRENPFQPLLAPAWDPEDAAARWRALHVAAPAPAPQPAPASPPRARRRRWWPLGRRDR